MKHGKAPTEIIIVKPRVKFDWGEDFPGTSPQPYATNKNHVPPKNINHRPKPVDDEREDKIELLRRRRSKEPSKGVKDQKQLNPLHHQHKKLSKQTRSEERDSPPMVTKNSKNTSPRQIYRIIKPRSTTPVKYFINQVQQKDETKAKDVGFTAQDLLQRRVVYRRFGNLSTDHIRVEELPDAVLPSGDNHIVIKILVSDRT